MKYKVNPSNFNKYRSYALLTGAAGGMGSLYCEQLALLGYNLILVDINAEGLEKAAAKAREDVAKISDFRAAFTPSFEVVNLVQDLSEVDAAAKIKTATDERGLRVDVLVNNAGILFATGIAVTPPKRLNLMVQIHCTASLMLCREYVPDMVARGGGYVLNISSLAAWMPWPCVGMYACTKRFVKDYSRSLRIETRGSGVSVTNAYFGAVDTPLIPLAPNLRKIAHGLGVMIWPQKAVDHAIKATFRRRKSTMPGVFNHLVRPIVAILPEWLLAWAYKKFGKYFAGF